MTRSVMTAVQQLLDALGVTAPQFQRGSSTADASDAGIAQLHSKAIPAARVLAPLKGIVATLPAVVTAHQREQLAQGTLITITWLTRALSDGTITGKTVTEQACELLCALSDVVVAGYIVVWSPARVGRSSSSSSSSSISSSSICQQCRAADFMQLGCAADLFMALAQATKQLNRHVLAKGSTVGPLLMFTTCVACDHMAGLLDGFWRDLFNPTRLAVQSQQDVRHSRNMIDWCIRSGLVSELSEAALRVMALDPVPWMTKGRPEKAALADGVARAVGIARRLQTVVSGSSMIEEMRATESYRHAWDSPLGQAARQGAGLYGTTPAPFLRANLVLLALGQYFMRVATLPPGTVLNQPKGSPQAVKALRAALRQQLTPSCCAQLLQRVAPGLWAVVTTEALPPDMHAAIIRDEGIMCTNNIALTLRAVGGMCLGYDPDRPPFHALGSEELQLLLECAEVYQQPAQLPDETQPWAHVFAAIVSCPYPALVEFNTRHGRTLLTLAERSLEAALAAAAAAGPGDSSGRSSSSSSSNRARQAPMETPANRMKAAGHLATCLCCCLSGEKRMEAAAGSNCYESKCYPADANWALLDSDTAPRLVRLMEGLVRTPRGTVNTRDILTTLPTHLPEMALFYSKPTTAHATLSAVISTTKWLQGRALALEMLLKHPAPGSAVGASAAAAAAVMQAVPGASGLELVELMRLPPFKLATLTLTAASILADVAVQSLVRPAALLDAATFEGAAAAALASAPAGRRSRAWLIEAALLADQPDTYLDTGGLALALATYKRQVLSKPQLLASILQQLQQGVGAHQAAAAARQAAKLAKKQGGDAGKLTEHLQALQVGASSSRSGGGDANSHPDTLLQGALMAEADTSSFPASSPAGGVPPVTPGDITVAANALLVACKAAGALLGVPQLLDQLSTAMKTRQQWPAGSFALGMAGHAFDAEIKGLLAAVQEVAEWAVLLHPLLVQLLPVEQGQVLVDLRGRLGGGGGGSSSNCSSVRQQASGASNQRLSAEEVAAVLGALQHVVIPGQPGCSNPRCCCLEGVSEADVKTQVCAACRGARYCSAACQKAHWRAGHKEVCKAAQAAAKAAATATAAVDSTAAT